MQKFNKNKGKQRRKIKENHGKFKKEILGKFNGKNWIILSGENRNIWTEISRDPLHNQYSQKNPEKNPKLIQKLKKTNKNTTRKKNQNKQNLHLMVIQVFVFDKVNNVHLVDLLLTFVEILHVIIQSGGSFFILI